MKLVVIGQGPSATSNGKPFGQDRGSAGKLADLLGVDHDEMHALCDVRNVLPRYRGRLKKGDRFPIAEARRAGKRIRAVLEGRVVLVVGKTTAKALGLKPEPMLVWRIERDIIAMVMPHPSGVNRWWNDSKNKRRATSTLRAVGRLAAGLARGRRAKRGG